MLIDGAWRAYVARKATVARKAECEANHNHLINLFHVVLRERPIKSPFSSCRNEAGVYSMACVFFVCGKEAIASRGLTRDHHHHAAARKRRIALAHKRARWAAYLTRILASWRSHREAVVSVHQPARVKCARRVRSSMRRAKARSRAAQ